MKGQRVYSTTIPCVKFTFKLQGVLKLTNQIAMNFLSQVEVSYF